MEIKDRRQVDLETADVELGYVRCPCGVRPSTANWRFNKFSAASAPSVPAVAGQ